MKPRRGKRVLMLIENVAYPLDQRVRLEANALAEAGYQVSVICPSAPGLARYDVVNSVRVFRYPAPVIATNFLGYLWEYGYSLVSTFILSLLVALHPGFDVIHAANPPDTAVIVAAFYKLFGKRFVYDHHDLAPELYDARFRGKSRRLVHEALLLFERLSCQLADHVIATNQSYRAIELERARVPAERITIVRNGPDLSRLRVVEPIPGLRREGRTNIIYVGMIENQDGVDYLFRALKHLDGELKRDSFHCIVVGSGGALSDLKSLAEQLGLSDHVFFVGFVKPAEVARYLCAGDIGVAPEPSNPLNDRSTMIKVMEYMVVGKPIVAFDLVETRYSAQDAALYARPNDELDFARQIAVLMDDPERCRKMGQIGMERIECELAWPHQAKHLLDMYMSLTADFGR